MYTENAFLLEISLQSVRIILLSVLAVAMIGVMVPSAFSYVDDGDFYVEYLETENFTEYRDWVKDGMGKKMGFFEDRVNDLNSKFRLPHDVPIYFHECETANAFYNGGEKYIVFCYELVEEIHSIMEKNHWSGDSAYATLGVVDWILFHEVKQDVMLQVLKIIEAQGAECAYPTSTIHLAQNVAAPV